MLDALVRVGLLEETAQLEGKQMLLRIVSMLVKLARNMEGARSSISAQPNESGGDV